MGHPCGHRRYTLDANPKIEHYVDDIVMSIKDRLIKEVKPTAVVLSGSLARGEGTVYEKNGKIHIVSDFEIGIVDSSLIKRRRIIRMSPLIAKKHGIDLTLLFFLPRRFTQCVPSNWAPVSSPLSIEQYELIKASRFLYGPDLRKHSPNIDAHDIPMWEGIRLLYNRMAEFSDAILNGKIHDRNRSKTASKLLIACGDAWLLANRLYHYLYKERMLRLQNRSEFNVPACPILSRREHHTILEAYRFKLYPNASDISFTSDYISDTLSISKKAFDLIIQNEMGLEFASCDDFYTKYLNHANIGKYCRTKPLLENIIALLKTRGQGVPITLKHFLSCTPVYHRVYAEIYLWLYGWFKPHWDLFGPFCPEKHRDRDMEESGKRLVQSWKQLCK